MTDQPWTIHELTKATFLGSLVVDEHGLTAHCEPRIQVGEGKRLSVMRWSTFLAAVRVAHDLEMP